MAQIPPGANHLYLFPQIEEPLGFALVVFFYWCLLVSMAGLFTFPPSSRLRCNFILSSAFIPLIFFLPSKGPTCPRTAGLWTSFNGPAISQAASHTEAPASKIRLVSPP